MMIGQCMNLTLHVESSMALIQIDRMGIKQAIDEINALRQVRSCNTTGSALVPSNCLIQWKDNHFVMDFTTTDVVGLNTAHYQGMHSFVINALGNYFEVPSRGASISNWHRTITSPDVVQLTVGQFRTQGLKDEQEYYLRYITPVSKQAWDAIDRGLLGYYYMLGKSQARTLYPLYLTVSDINVHHFVDDQGNNFLLIDSLSPISLSYMEKVAFNILLSFGMLFGEMPLDEAYMFVYESKDYKTPLALEYKSLVKTLKSDYSIFTTNVYSILVPLAIRKDPVNGEKRICNIITARKWGINELSLDVFCKLVQNFIDHEALSWGAFYLINACHFTMEMQPGAYSTALETITTEVVNNVLPKGSLNVIDAQHWNVIHTDLDNVIDQYTANGQITASNAVRVKAKINSLSGPTNIDKLSAPFAIYGYNLSTDDQRIIRQRNSVLHGSVKASTTIDQTFRQLQDVSLGVHRLCCTLLLKMAGYQGYIINNQRLFECDEKAKPFISI